MSDLFVADASTSHATGVGAAAPEPVGIAPQRLGRVGWPSVARQVAVLGAILIASSGIHYDSSRETCISNSTVLAQEAEAVESSPQISLAEAEEIALRSLLRAERRRLEFAEREAQVQAVWDVDS